MLAVVVAGLVTAEIVLRLFSPHLAVEDFSHRYLTVVFAMLLGGMLMGALVVLALIVGAGWPPPGYPRYFGRCLTSCSKSFSVPSAEGD